MYFVFFIATFHEAKAAIDQLQAKAGGAYFHFENGMIVISGIGPMAVYQASKKVPKENCVWINIGIAGAVSQEMSLGSCVRVGAVGRVKRADHQGTVLLETPTVIAPSPYILYSSSTPVYETLSSEKRALFDMEGYTFARIALQYRIPFHVEKVVSDYCQLNSPTLIASSMPSCSKEISAAMLRILGSRY